MVFALMAESGEIGWRHATVRGRFALGHRVQPAFSPWMTPCDPWRRHPRSPNQPKTAHRCVGILRARGQIQAPAGGDRMQHRREKPFVEPESKPGPVLLQPACTRIGTSLIRRLCASHGIHLNHLRTAGVLAAALKPSESAETPDRKSTRLNSSHLGISY